MLSIFLKLRPRQLPVPPSSSNDECEPSPNEPSPKESSPRESSKPEDPETPACTVSILVSTFGTKQVL